MKRKISFGGELPDKVKKEFKKYPDILGQLLFYRGLENLDDAEDFLKPVYNEDKFNPFSIKGMDLAVDRILKAIRENERVIIYSDYDADGISGAVILNDFFKKIGFVNFSNYIPNRLKEGYGLNKKAVNKFIQEKTDVLITIDCGITNSEEVALASKNGVDVIVTDHHLPGEELPQALAILNSKQTDDNYLDDMLCGAGVIFKFIQGLIQKGDFDIVEGWEKWLLDMVGLATIADMVPLKRENRVFAKYGLLVMRKSPRLGLIKLLKKIKVDQKYINEEDIGFMIAPRINAASRVADPQITFDLLSSEDAFVANDLAGQLDSLNNKRKTLVATAVREAKRKLKERELKDVIVIGSPEWNLGLSGLIASSLKDFYKRPCFVWGTNEEGEYCGSCRSDTVDLVELMSLADQGFFTHSGGHKAAAGFGISSGEIHFFEEKIMKAFGKILNQDIVEEIFVDKKLTLDDLNWENFNLIEKLAPFGVGNKRPLFMIESLVIKEARIFGKAKNHLEMTFINSKGNKVKAIDFFSQFIKDKKFILSQKQKVDILVNLERNTYGGSNELRLKIVDIV
ncbi:MAG: single-stranded-DNA-specific exonuclease RecJ [Patescibacteria group bacterium]|nr:single-stranded-DNA-specific exonuclease RecJ [Patescibacteria group bacterium]